MWYWLAQIIGALVFGFFLDNQKLSRRKRAIWGWAFLFVVINVVVSISVSASKKMIQRTDFPSGEEGWNH